MGAAFDLLPRQQDDIVVTLLQQQTLYSARALCVDALADQKRTRLLFEGCGGNCRGDFLRPLDARPGSPPHRCDRIAQRGDVRGRRSAASADRFYSEIANEGTQLGGKLVRALGIDRFAVRSHQRKAGVRNDADEAARVLAKKTDRVAHLPGTRRAVEPDDVHRERVERRSNRANVGTEEHATFGDEGGLSLNRDAPQSALELEHDSRYRRLEFEQVLHRLEHEQIGAAFDQRPRLLAVGLAQFRVGNV